MGRSVVCQDKKELVTICIETRAQMLSALDRKLGQGKLVIVDGHRDEDARGNEGALGSDLTELPSWHCTAW